MPRPTQEQIDELLESMAHHLENGSTKFRHASYEDGVEATVRWMLDSEEDHPYED